jgi:pyruvate formate lyase activating enzyme
MAGPSVNCSGESIERLTPALTTFCPHCAYALIVRDWYNILDYRITDDGHCRECGGAIAGRYQRFGKAFGPRRIPVRLAATVQ